MPLHKGCIHPRCRSDSRYMDKDHMKNVFFIPFPKPKRQKEKCLRWLAWLAKDRPEFGFESITSNTYVCCKHFHGGNGPQENYPDPMELGLSDKPRREKVKAFINNKCRCNVETTPPADLDVALHLEIPYSDTSVATTENEDDYNRNSQYNSNEFSEHDYSLGPITELPKLFNFELPRNWYLTTSQNETKLLKMFDLNGVLKTIILTVIIDKYSNYKIEVLGKLKTDSTHVMDLPQYIKSPKLLMDFLKKLDSLQVCAGNGRKEYLDLFERINSSVVHKCPYTNNLRHTSCELLNDQPCCVTCMSLGGTFRKMISRKRLSGDEIDMPHKMIRLGNMNKEELVSNLKKTVLEKNILEKELKNLKTEIKKRIESKGKTIAIEDLDQDALIKALEDHVQLGKNDTTRINSKFAELFLETQLKMLKEAHPTQRRWDPLVVQWCLYMYRKSPSLYRVLRETETLQLPCTSTLFRHNVEFKIEPGFQDKIFEKIVQEVNLASLPSHQHYFCLLLDEIKIKQDLVYKKGNGDIIGYTKLNDTYDKIAAMEHPSTTEKELATHALMIMLRGATSSVKYPIAHFATKALTAEALDNIVWEAVKKLESCGIKILCIIGDGASTNRKFFNTNGSKTHNYKCNNPYSIDNRSIYFIFDVPHLLKTVRNCVLSSTDDCKIRRLSINGQTILWKTFIDAFNEEQSKPGNLRKLHKITFDHVYINPFSKMRVKYAAQILSQSMVNYLTQKNDESLRETITFVDMFNTWFDIMNTRNCTEGYHQRNLKLIPFKISNDHRLEWLEQVFLPYLVNWEKQILQAPGNFTKEQRKKMILSRETYTGLVQTTKAMLEIIPFLINEGAEFIFTRHFNQDVLEHEFCTHRQSCGTATNPNLDQLSTSIGNLDQLRSAKLRISTRGENTEQIN